MDVSRYRKKGQPQRTNKLGHKLYEPTSRQVMYDKGTKLWIPYRKRCFGLWFKFLQHAERSPDHQVDWKHYDGWGGANVVLGTKFDEWWEERWKELFATKVKGEQPKFPLATQKPKPDGIRYALLIYENQHRGSNWEIAVWVQKQEEKKRYGVQSFFFADDTRARISG